MRTAHAHLISARIVARVVDFCRVRGHDGDALCRDAGLAPAVLADHEARVPYATVQRLGERALALTGDTNFGLHLAQDVRDTTRFDAGALLLMASPSVRAALETMVRHQRFWGDGDRASLVRVPGGLAVRWLLRGAHGEYARHSDECAMAEMTIGVRVLGGAPHRARAVRFRHAAPADLGEHRALFECPLEFGAAHTELVLDDAVLDAPMPHANAAFYAIFQQQVDGALARLATTPSETVHAAVRAALGAGRCTLAGTARAMRTSTRTLQRRLREEGTSFADVVDAVRHELALAYLGRGVAISETASLLGYADPTAFHRAFRRWTGSSPARAAAPKG